MICRAALRQAAVTIVLGRVNGSRSRSCVAGSRRPFQVSTQFGDPSVWPGDTTGLSTLGANQVTVSWGSAVDAKNKKSDIYATTVSVR